MNEQWPVVTFAEDNSHHNNFLFSVRRGECMYKKKQVSVNSMGLDLDVSSDFHMEKTVLSDFFPTCCVLSCYKTLKKSLEQILR